jgi:uncharacterized coiled-coil protein SlyX
MWLELVALSSASEANDKAESLEERIEQLEKTVANQTEWIKYLNTRLQEMKDDNK